MVSARAFAPREARVTVVNFGAMVGNLLAPHLDEAPARDLTGGIIAVAGARAAESLGEELWIEGGVELAAE